MGIDLGNLDPISWISNGVCSLLNDCGVSKSVTDGIETGLAVAFCDPVLGYKAAEDLAVDNRTPQAFTQAPPCNGNQLGYGVLGVPNFAADASRPEPGCFSLGDGLQDILDDPTLSTEDKIMAVMERCMQATDGEINQTLDSLDKASQNSDGSTSNNDVQRLQLQLQRLMTQRQEMYSMMTNISKTFQDMSMAAINNMRG